MSPVLHLARTEILEHRRQRSMLGVLVANYVLWIGVFGAVFLSFDQAMADPATAAALRAQAQSLGVSLDTVLALAVSTFGSFMFTNLPLFVATLSGYSVLHDRACGTLPFLLLAPVTRRQLLLGKLLGAMALPLAFHLVFVALGCLALGRLPTLAPYDAELGGSGAWWVAFLLGAPASGVLVGAIGTLISALSRDVRTSMQWTSFFIGLLSLLFGYAMVDGLAWGVPLQLAFAATSVTLGGGVLLVGERVISREVAG